MGKKVSSYFRYIIGLNKKVNVLIWNLPGECGMGEDKKELQRVHRPESIWVNYTCFIKYVCFVYMHVYMYLSLCMCAYIYNMYIHIYKCIYIYITVYMFISAYVSEFCLLNMSRRNDTPNSSDPA